jgi:predicted Fe-S protein YdhL (DUF1289 family)
MTPQGTPPPPGLSQPGPVAGAAVPSPCTNVCRMNARTGWCEGCFRRIDEIAAWSTMGDEAKRRVWALLPGRRAQAGRNEEPT